MILDILLGLDQIPEADIVEIGKKEIGPDEEVLGVVGLRARRLYSVVRQQTKLAVAKIMELQTKVATLDDLKATAEQLELDIKRGELLKTIFWQEVWEGLGEKNKPEICIRKGWEVVADHPKRNPIMDFIDNIESIVPDCGDPNCLIHGKSIPQP